MIPAYCAVTAHSLRLAGTATSASHQLMPASTATPPGAPGSTAAADGPTAASAERTTRPRTTSETQQSVTVSSCPLPLNKS